MKKCGTTKCKVLVSSKSKYCMDCREARIKKSKLEHARKKRETNKPKIAEKWKVRGPISNSCSGYCLDQA